VQDPDDVRLEHEDLHPISNVRDKGDLRAASAREAEYWRCPDRGFHA
jgi:hypothetical protein